MWVIDNGFLVPQLPLVYGGDCGSKFCYPGWLDSSKVAEKVVICDRGGNARAEKGNVVSTCSGKDRTLSSSPCRCKTIVYYVSNLDNHETLKYIFARYNAGTLITPREVGVIKEMGRRKMIAVKSPEEKEVAKRILREAGKLFGKHKPETEKEDDGDKKVENSSTGEEENSSTEEERGDKKGERSSTEEEENSSSEEEENSSSEEGRAEDAESKMSKAAVKRRSKTAPKKDATFRQSMLTFHNIFSSIKLKEGHVEKAKKTTFWNLIQPFLTNSVNKKELFKEQVPIIKLLERWSKAEQGFLLGDQVLRIDREDIALCFGIVCGDEKINLNMGKQVSHELLRYTPGVKQLKHGVIKKNLIGYLNAMPATEWTEECVVKLMILYLLAKTVLGGSSCYLKWGILKYVEDLQQIDVYDWASLIRNQCNDALNKLQAGEEDKCFAFVPFFIYLVAEHSRGLFVPKDGNAFPRFLKWNYKEVARVIQKTNFKSLTPSMIIPSGLRRTPKEVRIFKRLDAKLKGKEEDDDNDAKVTRVQVALQDEVTIRNGIINKLKTALTKAEGEIKALKRGKSVVECKDCTKLQEKLISQEELFQVERANFLETIGKLNEELQRMKDISEIRLSTPIVDGKEKDMPCSSAAAEVQERKKKKKKSESERDVVRAAAASMPSFNLLDLTPKLDGEEVGEKRFEKDQVIVGDKKRGKGTLKIPKWLTSKEDIKKLLKIDEDMNGDASSTCWKCKETFLTIDDFRRVLDKSFITDKLIDAWGYLLCKEENNAHAFPAHLWPFFMANQSRSEKVVRKGLDTMTQKRAKYGFFPICIPGKGANAATHNSNGNHWVLLSYDMEDNVWNFYNSMRPRAVGHSDKHMEEAAMFVEFVHNILKAQTQEANCWGAGFSEESEKCFNRVWASPQQGRSTVDCAFMVMMVMESIAKTGVVAEKIESSEVLEFKRKIIKQLVNSPEFLELPDMDEKMGKKRKTSEDVDIDGMVDSALKFATEPSNVETVEEVEAAIREYIDEFPEMGGKK